MPDLNPLKFTVAIQDDATKKLEKIEEEFQKLKDKTITVKVEGLNELKSLLETLRGSGQSSLSKDSEKLAKDVEMATAALNKELQILEQLKKASAELSAQQKQDSQSGPRKEKVESLKAEIAALKEKETATKSEIESLGKMAAAYDKVASSVEKVNRLIESIHQTPSIKGNFGMFMEGRDNMGKDKALADMQTFLKSIRFMQDELKSAMRPDAIADLVGGVSTLVNALKTETTNIGSAISALKRTLKNDTLDDASKQNIQERISMLESLKTSYKNAYDVMSRHGANYYNNMDGDYAKEELEIRQRNLATIRQQITEKEKLLAVEQQGAQGARQQTEAAKEYAAVLKEIAQLEKRNSDINNPAKRNSSYQAERERLINSKGELNKFEQEELRLQKAFETMGAGLKRRATDWVTQLSEIKNRFGTTTDIFGNGRYFTKALNQDEFNAYVNKLYDNLQKGNVNKIETEYNALKKALSDLKKESNNIEIKGNPIPLIESLKKLKAEYEQVLKLSKELRERQDKNDLGFFNTPSSKAYQNLQELKKRPKAEYEELEKNEERLEKLRTRRYELSRQIAREESENNRKEAQTKEALIAQEERVAKAKEKVTQATQAQAQAAQAQQTLSQKEVGTIAKNAVIEELKKSLGYIAEAKEAIKNDSFTAFTKRVELCVEAIKKLTEAFAAFKTTIGGDKDLKDLMVGWGAAIREVTAAMAALNAAKSSGKVNTAAQKEEMKQQEQGLVKVADAIGRVRGAMASGGTIGGIPFLENINVIGERNIQTLIKEQGHIERLIAIAKKSIDFGEGHPVLGMGRLRGDQMRNLQDLEALKKVITEILFAANQGDQAMIRFLNTSGALRTTPFGKDAMGNDVTLLGGHFDKLTHSVTGTASAMRNLNNEMRLDSNVWPNAEQESNTRRYNQLLADAEKLLRRIDEAGSKGSKLGLDTSLSRVGSRDVSMFLDKALKFEDMGNFRALNELIGQFQRLKAVYGEVAKEQEKMNTSRVAAGEKADAQYMKEVEAYTKRCIQEYNNWQESIRRAGVEATNLKVKLRELENVERRGQAAGVDTTTLKSRIQALRQELSILQEINGGSKAYGLTKDYVKTEAYHERVKLAQEEMRIVNAAAAEKERADNKAIKDLEAIETNQRRYNQLLSEAQALQERLANASSKGGGLFLDVSKTETALNQLQQHIDQVLNFDTRNMRDNHAVSELIARWNALKKTLQSVATEQERLNTTQEKTNKSSASAAAKQAQQENDKWAESMRRASIEATKLKIQIDKLREIEAAGRHAGVDTSSLSAKIAELNALRQTLLSMSFGAKIHGTAGDLVNSAAFQNTTRLANQEADAVKKSAQEKEKAAMATQQLTAEQQRLSQALSQTTEHMKGQSQLLSDLKSLATQYLGVWGGQQFLNNIIQIGGQLEMQRLSIGAILQNQSQANTLFNQIKGLATQSPFGVVELDQMTKQLTAYGFKYHELFDMTKRLADISAATGTSVDRLALALGHVRSEAALSGYTLRQFSMGNVPLLQKLSEKLGKTTKEIRDMVKKKEISYDDVVGVLKDLTDDGGMFYNMQEVISQSVKAKFKNVKDAMDIMYGEMAEGSIGDALKGIASVLMELTRNWKDVATVMGTVAVLWGVHRAAVMVYTQTLGTANAQTMASIAAHRQKEAAMLREAQIYRALTASEQTQLAASRAMTVGMRTRIALGMQLTMSQRRRLLVSRQQQVMDMALALSEKKLTTENILRQVALGRLSKAQARTIIELADLSAVERQAAMNALNGTQQIGMFSMALRNLGNSALGALAKLGKFLLNPQMLIMAGITAAMELWQRNSREVERAEEVADSIYQHSQDAIRNTKTMMQSDLAPMGIVDKGGTGINTTSLNFDNISNAKIKFPEVDRSDMQQVVDEWTTYIENYAANAGQILNEASFDAQGNLLPLEERFNNLKKAIEEVVLAQYGLQNIGDVFGNAIKKTNGGWLDDDVLSDISDYDKKIRSFSSNVATAYRKYQKAIDDGVKAAIKQSDSFAKATESMDTYAQMFDYLAKNQDQYQDAWSAFQSVGGTGDAASDLNSSLFSTTSGDVNKAKEEMLAELDSFYIQVEAEMQTRGVNLNNLTKQQQQAMLIGYKKQLESIQGLSQETMNWLMEMFAQHFDIPFSLDDSKFVPKVNEVTETLNNLVEGDWKIELDFVEHMNDAIDEARKKYKLAKEYFEKTEKIRLKFGIDLKIGQLMDDKTKQSILSKIENEDIRKEVEKVINGLNQASTAFNKSTEASRNLGFSLEDEKKSKKKKEKKKGTTKAYKDEFAKRWDERIRIMKEAHDWYRKWEKEVGHDEAIKETFAKYQDIFKEWKEDKILPLDFDVNDIDDFQKYVEKIYKDALDRYNKQKNNKLQNYGQEAQRVYRQAAAVLEDIKFDNLKEAAEDFKSIIEQTITDLNNRWDIFNTVRSTTGDVALASRIAGFGIDEMRSRTSADAMRAELIRQLRGAGGEELVSAIPLDAHLDEEGIRNMLQKAIPSSDNAEEYKNKIDGLIRSYQEWQRLQQQVYKDDVSVFANLIGSVVSYDAKVNKLNDDLRKQKESISAALASGAIKQEDADMANAIAEAKFDWDSMKLSADYANIYNHAIAMSRQEFDEAANAIEKLLERLRELELISDEDYLSEIEKLSKARREWSETGFLGERGAVGSFISGGNDGLMNYYAERRDKANRKAAQYQEGSAENKKWKDEADHYGELFNKLSKLSDAAKDVVTAFQTLQSGLDLVTNLFDSLGMEGAANAAGDAGGILGGAMQGASALSALGPWGMAAGAALGLVSGIAQTHDKALERQIGKLREDVQRIEANTKLIQQARERTLGLDNGILRRLYAQQYESSTSKAQRDMYEYYSRNSLGNGYQQEFNNLIQQRQDYLSILDKQESKKKKSQSDIEETKSKIAELDDQIRFFSQDLAKELWDIDIKGWADQLSDALASAFENGESMAKAYKDTVTSILQSLAQKMMKTAYLEKMFNSLQDRLFGPNGVVDPTDMQGSMSKATSVIADFFGKGGEGEQTITAATEFMTAFQRGLESSGLSLLNDSGKTLSASVQGTSEETSNLLAAYVNALRQDVSINRLLLTEFIAQLWPSYVEEFTNHVRTVARIDTNVQVMMEMMRDGRGAMYEEIHSLRSRVDNVVNGIESFAMK